jgi:hypothetical protein
MTGHVAAYQSFWLYRALPSSLRAPEIMNDDVREFIRNVALAAVLVVAAAILFLTASMIVSALI